ncbi:diguanylate cyclase (GGDEF domain) with PAS/PAC sensor [hydrothermal vent metagenome]|uniref:Diguanylate cyclase (GGDEF domain) with PAS/PAC sensor n=1 Tax=hydrothermal vent metagenome TaxID=652676 RepID=A0A1W1D3D6_9ZZZZ
MIQPTAIFDGIISLNKKDGAIKNIWLSEALKNLSLQSKEDLENFFQTILHKKVCPLLAVFQHQEKTYVVFYKIFQDDVVFFFQNISAIKKLLFDKEEVLLDGLTKCYLKKEIEAFITQALEYFIRYKKEKFSVIMFDIDFFKKVNDTYGHLAGDFVLKELATLVKTSLRKSDVCGRFGGEEFLILLPNTRTNGAFELANKLNNQVKNHSFIYNEQKIPITISIGITSASYTDSFHSLIQRCDEALYLAKKNGRNRVQYQ